MNPVLEAVLRADRTLRKLGARYAVIGGLAVSERAKPRFTQDADLAVAVGGDDEAEALVFQLMREGYRVHAQIEQEATGRLATVRLQADGQTVYVLDLLFASSGIEAEIVAGAERRTVVPGLTIPVASVAHLIVLKLLSRDDRRRPNDADDLKALREVATEEDWAEAARAAALVHERGYDRGRDLLAALSELRAAPPW